MLRYQRPEEPVEFARAVAAERAKITRLASQGRVSSTDFRKLWSPFKPAFAERQHGKCGFCEMRVIGTHLGDVEHYRPKAMLQALPIERSRWGREEQHSTKVVGRELHPPLCETGYHWLAYEWNNYLLACDACNRWWKMNLFPVRENPRPLPPQPGQPETPLLLNPFEGEDPTAHLAFTALGQIEPHEASLYGRATIDTCGLDRESLRQSRHERAEDAFRQLRVLAMELDADHLASACEAGELLVRWGRPESLVHPGMVRAIVLQGSGYRDWEEFVSWLAELRQVLSSS